MLPKSGKQRWWVEIMLEVQPDEASLALASSSSRAWGIHARLDALLQLRPSAPDFDLHPLHDVIAPRIYPAWHRCFEKHWFSN